MTFHTYKLEHFPFDSESKTYGSASEVSGVISISVTKSIGMQADTFTVSFDDPAGDMFALIGHNDRLKIYGSLDGGASYVQLIDGVIDNRSQRVSTDAGTLSLSGFDLLEKALSGLVRPSGGKRTADNWIKDQILGEINENNLAAQQITWASSNPSLASEFAVELTRGYTPGIELIEELSQPGKTDDRYYIYYLNNDAELIWEPRPSAVSDTFTIGDNVLSTKYEEGTWDVINYIILFAGKSPYGASINQLAYDVTSINDFGWKTKYVAQPTIAERMRTLDRNKQVSLNVSQEGTDFPQSSAYPYKPNWGFEGDEPTVDSDAEYNEEFVTLALSVAEDVASRLLRNNSEKTGRVPRITVEPTLSYSPGDKYNYVNQLVGFTVASPKNDLRLETVGYEFGTSGWDVSINLTQDQKV